MTRTIDIDDIPGDCVAERLCRKLRSRVPGFLMTTSRNDRPAKIVTARRVLSVYYSGSIEQSLTAYCWSDGSMSTDPYAFTAWHSRQHAIYLDIAAANRRRGDKFKARTYLDVARSLRTQKPLPQPVHPTRPAFVMSAK